MHASHQEGKIVKRANMINKNGDHPICCNSCGKVLKVENGILKEDAFEATKEWGYFSNRDMEVHQFNLCEECYDKIISEFAIPVEVRKKLEAL
jgi:Fe2+ or Zn2+ uptake regulation protein